MRKQACSFLELSSAKQMHLHRAGDRPLLAVTLEPHGLQADPAMTLQSSLGAPVVWGQGYRATQREREDWDHRQRVGEPEKIEKLG